VVEAIGVVAVGGSVLGPSAAATILEQWRRLRENREAPETSVGTLTARESDVLMAMAEGLGAKSIARRLGVAVKTVESHKFRIFEKLGVHTQAHAVSVAITHGLVTAPVEPPATAAGPAPAAAQPALVGSEQP